MNKKLSQLTIVLVSYKSKEKIVKLISLLKNKIKIIVVENSNDRSIYRELTNKKKIKFFYPKENNGFGAGLNYGIRKSRTKYILYLDIDIKISYKKIIHIFNKTLRVKNFGAITAKLKNKINYKNLITGYDNKNQMKYLSYNTGCLMMFDKKIFLNMHGFDERFFLYFEETDYYYRCIKKDKKIYLIDNVIIDHIGRSSIDEKFRNKYEKLRNWHYCWSKFNFYLKHFNYFVALRKTLPNLLKSIKKIIKFTIKQDYNNLNLHLHELKGLFAAYAGLKSYYRID